MDLSDYADFSLRFATINDIDILYEWANDSLTRKNSFSSNIISYDEHKMWFYSILNDKSVIQLIFEKCGYSIGQIRISIDNQVGIIGYSIAPDERGKGYGTILCEMMIDFVKKNTDIKKLVSKVKIDNVASIRCFEKSGFEAVYEQLELRL